jgi:hypothetical protein
MSAVGVVKDVFAARNIGTDQLPAVSVAPLPINRRGAARTFRPGKVRFDHSGVVQYPHATPWGEPVCSRQSRGSGLINFSQACADPAFA